MKDWPEDGEQENEWLQKAQAGDTVAETKLLSYYRGMLNRFFERLIAETRRDPGITEELTQRAMMVVGKHFWTYQKDVPLSHYVAGIGRNTFKGYLKEKYRMEITVDDETILDALESKISASASDYWEADNRSLAERFCQESKMACTGNEHEILLMYYQGETFTSIADMMSIPEGTVRSHFLRARAKLIAHLVMHAPDLLGSSENMAGAWRKAQNDPSDPLTPDEMRAFEEGPKRGNTEAFRSACLKMARHLPLPLFTLLLALISLTVLALWGKASAAQTRLAFYAPPGNLQGGMAYGR